MKQLPPVGTKCRVQVAHTRFLDCEIIAHATEDGELHAIYQADDQFGYTNVINHFSPRVAVPKPLHVGEEDIMTAALNMMDTELCVHHNIQKLYDAGMLKMPAYKTNAELRARRLAKLEAAALGAADKPFDLATALAGITSERPPANVIGDIIERLIKDLGLPPGYKMDPDTGAITRE